MIKKENFRPLVAALTAPIGIGLIALSAMVVISTAASAGTTGTEFKALYDLLFGWINGYLGRAIAIAASIAGALFGLAKQSPIIAMVGVIFALVLSIGPGVINGILSAIV